MAPNDVPRSTRANDIHRSTLLVCTVKPWRFSCVYHDPLPCVSSLCILTSPCILVFIIMTSSSQQLADVLLSNGAGQGAVVLLQVDGFALPLSIFIGVPEAMSIVYSNGMDFRRPPTIDTWTRSLLVCGCGRGCLCFTCSPCCFAIIHAWYSISHNISHNISYQTLEHMQYATHH